MLTLRRPRRRRRSASRLHPAAAGSLLEHPDLRIGNLLDDPRLRRAMGIDAAAPGGPNRDLLDDTAA